MLYFPTALILSLLLLPAVFGQVTFDAPRAIQYPSPQYAVAVGDLNEDGLPDLIAGGDPVASEPGKIYVSINAGNGNFIAAVGYQVGSRASDSSGKYVEELAVADVDNDGHLDVVVGHNGSRGLSNPSSLLLTILAGNGSGTLVSADALQFSQPQDPFSVSGLIVTDVDNDGLKDVVVGCRGVRDVGAVYLVRNLGSRAFQPTGPRPVYGGTGIAVGHFNRDAYIDVAFSSSTDGITQLYGNGSFNFLGGALVQSRDHLADLVTGDFNNDGRSDLAVSEYQAQRVRVLIHRRSSWPRFPVNVYFHETRIFPDVMESGYINADAHEDLIVADGRTGGMEIFYGSASGDFVRSASLFPNTPAADLKLGDFDNNGRRDIVTANLNVSPEVQVQLFLQVATPPSLSNRRR